MQTRLLLALLSAVFAASPPPIAAAEGALAQAAKEFVDHLMEHGAREAAAKLQKIVQCQRAPGSCDKTVDAGDVGTYGRLSPSQREAVRHAIFATFRNPPIAPDRSLTGR